MIKSLIRYSYYFSVTVFKRRERRLLWRDLNAYFLSKEWKKKTFSKSEKENALHSAANWLLHNQHFNSDAGFSTYYIAEGHTSSYPETSGYIIDSLFNYSKKFSKPEILLPLYNCADWLVSIQKPSGGWQGGYVNENKKEIVFNTGQVMRGLLKAYHESKNEKYLTSCVNAGNWLCRIQENDGSWRKSALMNTERVYESYVSAVLLELWKVSGNENFKNAAVRNVNRIIENKISPTGWFMDCDNTVQHNQRPILHTIAYTIDGLIDCGLVLEEEKYIQAILKATDILLEKFSRSNWLGGRFTNDWRESEAFICTGGAQMSIVWMKLYRITGDKKYLNGAKKMNDWLCWIQSGTVGMGKAVEGGLQGSFPLFGRYEPFAFPNWATKYLLDALRMELEIDA
jgi:Prenyltransferase and squalene oxidase repeat